ncbi:MAG: hypothetical protein ACRDFB_07915 [Rhabdochlamydiaceae bacterium]
MIVEEGYDDDEIREPAYFGVLNEWYITDKNAEVENKPITLYISPELKK